MDLLGHFSSTNPLFFIVIVCNRILQLFYARLKQPQFNVSDAFKHGYNLATFCGFYDQLYS